jgi:hypothetical protein
VLLLGICLVDWASFGLRPSLQPVSLNGNGTNIPGSSNGIPTYSDVRTQSVGSRGARDQKRGFSIRSFLSSSRLEPVEPTLIWPIRGFFPWAGFLFFKPTHMRTECHEKATKVTYTMWVVAAFATAVTIWCTFGAKWKNRRKIIKIEKYYVGDSVVVEESLQKPNPCPHCVQPHKTEKLPNEENTVLASHYPASAATNNSEPEVTELYKPTAQVEIERSSLMLWKWKKSRLKNHNIGREQSPTMYEIPKRNQKQKQLPTVYKAVVGSTSGGGRVVPHFGGAGVTRTLFHVIEGSTSRMTKDSEYPTFKPQVPIFMPTRQASFSGISSISSASASSLSSSSLDIGRGLGETRVNLTGNRPFPKATFSPTSFSDAGEGPSRTQTVTKGKMPGNSVSSLGAREEPSSMRAAETGKLSIRRVSFDDISSCSSNSGEGLSRMMTVKEGKRPMPRVTFSHGPLANVGKGSSTRQTVREGKRPIPKVAFSHTTFLDIDEEPWNTRPKGTRKLSTRHVYFGHISSCSPDMSEERSGAQTVKEGKRHAPKS